ncbi:MAG: hypothetical protein JXJ17_14105 [Anaerolineae bacterium]|nr:hypothetical protein [Anaerolineae bacterium]
MALVESVFSTSRLLFLSNDTRLSAPRPASRRAFTTADLALRATATSDAGRGGKVKAATTL